MSIKEATHTGSNGKYFYKESGVRYTIDGFKRYPREYQSMMFWDAHCDKWRESIVNGTDLTPVK